MERKVLGRGLDALISQESVAPKERIQMVPVGEIRESQYQPRSNFSPEKIEELASSIKEKGVIQPILVRQSLDGKYELIAGERRWRAAKQLDLKEMPAIVRKVSDADLLEISIIENIQREELNPIEEARAYRRLAMEFGLQQETIAQRVGKDKSTISNLLRLLNLPDLIQEHLSKNFITFGHAKALLALSDEKSQMALCERILKEGLSVRQAEAGTFSRAGKKRAKRAQSSDEAEIYIRELEARLRERFGTKVKIHHGKKRGKIEVEYYSAEDLERIVRSLGISE